jgi:MoxR-like ATPase
MPKFTVQEGYDKRAEIELKEGELKIGRDLDNDVIINEGNVSRHHTKVTMKDNRVTVEDLGSQNGTFVNSLPIDGVCELKHMDVVQVGKNVFVFSDSDAPLGMRPNRNQAAMKTSEYYTFSYLSETIKKIETNINKVLKGKPEVIRNLLICMFADGHILIEDAPGVGKSVLAQALAKSIKGTYKRIQFTPDMLPSDITGISIYDKETSKFSFMPGPIFGNIILADEINRTTPRTQSSLLECMSESVITIDGNIHVLPKPFFVIATQNPSDYHGTYPLPEPQLDRFLMRISIGYPDEEAEKEILTSQMSSHPLNNISYVVEAMEIVQCQAQVRRVHISEPIKDYIVKIAAATREHPALSTGCSPRASLALMRMSQSFAAYYGREYVLPRDVKELIIPVLAHRITLKLKAQGEWGSSSEVLKEIIKNIPLENEE